MGGARALSAGRHLLALYILCFSVGVLSGCFLLYFLSRRRRGDGHHGVASRSSEKGRDLLGSSATPQSPSSASLLSEGFPLTEKRNVAVGGGGHGNGGHHGSYGGNLLLHHHNNGGANLGNGGYGNANWNASGGLKLGEIGRAHV